MTPPKPMSAATMVGSRAGDEGVLAGVGDGVGETIGDKERMSGELAAAEALRGSLKRYSQARSMIPVAATMKMLLACRIDISLL